MARAIALASIQLRPSLDWLRFTVVAGCALALILADRVLPQI